MKRTGLTGRDLAWVAIVSHVVENTMANKGGHGLLYGALCIRCHRRGLFIREVDLRLNRRLNYEKANNEIPDEKEKKRRKPMSAIAHVYYIAHAYYSTCIL